MIKMLSLVLIILIASVCVFAFEGIDTKPIEAFGKYNFGPNTRILFFGDSITTMGDINEGYVNQLRNAATKNKNVEIIGKGIGSERVMNLQDRFDGDVLRQNPTIVVIFIGINDIYYAQNHLDWAFDRYVSGMEHMITELKNRNILPIVVIPSVIGEMKNGGNPLDKELDRLADLATEIGKKHDVPVVNVLQVFRDYLAEYNLNNDKSGILTLDGIHLNPKGDTLVASVMAAELMKVLDANRDNITISIAPYDYEHYFYSNTEITISSITPRTDADIRYTLDGTEPDSHSPVYSAPVRIENDTIIKAALFVEGKQVSEVFTSAFNKLEPTIKPRKHIPNWGMLGGNGDPDKLFYSLYIGLRLDDLPKDYIFSVDDAHILWIRMTDRLDLSSIIECIDEVATKNPDSDTNWKTNFAVSFYGYIWIKEPGIYVFKLVSDDSSALLLEDKLIVDNVAHDMILDTTNAVALDEGYYKLNLVYFQKDNTYMLLTEWKTPNTTRFTIIPAEVLGQIPHSIAPPLLNK